MESRATPDGRLVRIDDGHVYGFSAMASPCEVRIKSDDGALALMIGQAAEAEARRIEVKYSRYRADSTLSQINASGGVPVTLDDETANLIDYAAQCHALSGGRFDITSGVLRRIWRFDGSDNIPDTAAIQAVRPLIGWNKLDWQRPALVLPAGMELDLGGLGKEYAVDRAALAVMALGDTAVLINFGGDLRATAPPADGSRWRAAIEAVDGDDTAGAVVEIASGALATSGDARRFLFKAGVRYSHILDPRTGWPVRNPPRSVTVAAPSCIEAGFLSTLAMLHGAQAERFLKREGVPAWVVR